MLRGRLAVLAAVGFAAAVLTPGVAGAQGPQDGSDEVPIGTFTLGDSHSGFSVAEPPDGVSRREQSNDGSGWFFEGLNAPKGESVSAEGLFKDALTALDAGRRDEAQRLFEQLIADAPNSPLVAKARQHLGQIYLSTEAAASSDRKAPGTADANQVATGSVSPPPLERPVSVALSRAVVHQARVSPSLDNEFLSQAGDRVFFSVGSADLGVRARGVVQSQARFLLLHPELSVAIEGHADDGAIADADSQRISEQRAVSVRERLVAEGVAAERIVAYGRGRADRVSDCAAPECSAQNRRVVSVLLNRRIAAGTGTAGDADSDAEAPAQ